MFEVDFPSSKNPREGPVLISDPDLIYDKCLENAPGYEGTLSLFPPNHTTKVVRPELSGNPPTTQKVAWSNNKTHVDQNLHLKTIII